MEGGKKLYLVQAELQRSEYMSERRRPCSSVTRLVLAFSAEGAEEIFCKKYEVNDPYGTSVDVVDIIVEEALE